jgi:hypothetical protein
MTRFMLGIVMALLLSGPVAAECTYQGVAYSEGARVCMHRTSICVGVSDGEKLPNGAGNGTSREHYHHPCR